jgi:hypothetical protein
MGAHQSSCPFAVVTSRCAGVVNRSIYKIRSLEKVLTALRVSAVPVPLLVWRFSPQNRGLHVIVTDARVAGRADWLTTEEGLWPALLTPPSHQLSSFRELCIPAHLS